VVLAVASAGCTYDFDGAFSGSGGAGGEVVTTSATGGAGGTGGSGGGASTGGGLPDDEQCFNGLDDDGDELVDCADPDCEEAQCLPPAPDGWSGPTPLFVGDPADAPSCPSGLTTIAADIGPFTAPAASCTPCSCSGPTGGTCGVGTTTIYDSTNQCSGSVEETLTPPAPNVCVSFSLSDPYARAQADPVPVDVPGSCQPSGGAANVPAASFAQAAVLCDGVADDTAMGGGCDDQICVPSLAAPFTQLCIFTAGDVPCVADGYPDKTVLYDGYDDDRGCTACGCDAASGQTCSGTTQLYVGSNCNNLDTTVPHDGLTCESYTTFQSMGSAKFIPAPGGPSGGSCSATGGNPKGSATPKGPITVCCAP